MRHTRRRTILRKSQFGHERIERSWHSPFVENVGQRNNGECQSPEAWRRIVTTTRNVLPLRSFLNAKIMLNCWKFKCDNSSTSRHAQPTGRQIVGPIDPSLPPTPADAASDQPGLLDFDIPSRGARQCRPSG